MAGPIPEVDVPAARRAARAVRNTGSNGACPAAVFDREAFLQHLRILVAEDHPPTRARIVGLLSCRHEIVGAVEDGAALLSEADRLSPDLVVVDISMPLMGGLEAIRCYRRSHPGALVLVLTSHTDPVVAETALATGATGFVSKVRAAEELLAAVEEVANGRVFVSPLIFGR